MSQLDGLQQPIEFPELTAEDDQRTLELCREIWIEKRWPVEMLGTSVKAIFSEPGDAFLIAKQGANVIGTAGLLRLSDTEVALKRFYLTKKMRGTGLASRLLDEVANKARSMGYSTLMLDVALDNAEGMRFWEKQKLEECTVTTHPRWAESSPEGQSTHRFFRMHLQS